MTAKIKAAPPAVRAGRASLTSLVTLVSGLITSLLVAEVPAWHHGLPYFVTYLIPVLVAAAGAFITHYVTKQPVTLAEVEAFVLRYGKVATPVPPPGMTSASGGKVSVSAMAPYGADVEAHLRRHLMAYQTDAAAKAALDEHMRVPQTPVVDHDVNVDTDANTETTPGMGSNASDESVAGT